jgi:hypothetical protein
VYNKPAVKALSGRMVEKVRKPCVKENNRKVRKPCVKENNRKVRKTVRQLE